MNKDLHKRIVDAKVKGLTVYEMPTFCEIVLGKIPVQHVSDLWFVYVPISGVRKNDPRITRVGKILRVSRFDEIPQLWG